MATDRRQNGYGTSGFKGQNMMNHYAQAHGGAQYLPRGLPISSHIGDNPLQNLTNNMSGLNLHASYGSSGTNKSGASMMSSTSSDYNGLQGQGLWVPNQHVLNSMYQVLPGAGQQQASPGMYNHAGAFVPAYQYSQGIAENPAMAANWSGRISSAEMPSLMTPRRDSISSNENDIPGTPYNGSGPYRYGPSAAIIDRSPNGVYANSATPSPSQLAHGYQLVAPLHKAQSMPTLSPRLLALVNKEPSIPRAIPAPNSPAKPLDRSLENKSGETNVYIRGLLPETTDEMLHSWGARFGDIQSSKSIIDNKTELCKGFGFIKYHNFEDAENCIRGFHYLGYEVSFARESFYSKLKKFSDEQNTNLYISTLPKNFNEHELSAIFAPHKVCSSRILRDAAGTPRGVGFARMESRDVCEEIIKKFNNTPVSKPGTEEHIIQIRYADTHEQKLLKQQTAAGRVFRAHEYEVGVAQARALSAPDRFLSISPEQHSSVNEFEMFLQRQSNGAPFVPNQRYRQPYAPAVPSTLGTARPTMPPMLLSAAQVPGKAGRDGSDDEGVENKPSPATPAKTAASSSSPARESGREE
ncbi:hypothetical protein BU24DRAFT_400627 [Aaosphaeria arxii CBS 175.79]|uniref:RRM domain-containing protein n=1 Tax=Aaosphaeria arxii CBS 175.79 TaxID=1450172 RepID=A0A6A5XAM4_9PLEO|nr:uncharacterized protein BU24DRAFT_400627 [Aaosphaeria arxii CBS 175.79]KAF2010012.1 hypothetical protein BU24DRAFT_400627 [Aaosphaeria arxii CBS 175.79]